MNERQIISIDEMKDKIKKYGHKAIWKSIEGIGKWQDRIAFRQIFFLVGGNLDED